MNGVSSDLGCMRLTRMTLISTDSSTAVAVKYKNASRPRTTANTAFGRGGQVPVAGPAPCVPTGSRAGQSASADEVTEHVTSAVAQDSGVLRARHGDRLVVLYGRGVAAVEVAPRGAVLWVASAPGADLTPVPRGHSVHVLLIVYGP